MNTTDTAKNREWLEQVMGSASTESEAVAAAYAAIDAEYPSKRYLRYREDLVELVDTMIREEHEKADRQLALRDGGIPLCERP